MSKKKLNVGRNAPCPCGSGKKFKKCHGGVAATSVSPRAEAPSDHHGSAFNPLMVVRTGNPDKPFIVHEPSASGVPAEVITKALSYFAEHERCEHERVRRLGHVRPEISGDFRGYKFVAIGSRLMYMPSDKCRFFTDVLIAYVPQLFGREWFEREIAKPPHERHPVMQWRVKGMTFMNSQPPLPDGSYGAIPTGPLQAYITFAYDLYIVEHNARLDARLLERLKNNDQFQGARHEVFAEATCLRAGFEIEHEDETDGTRRHAEFTATHKATDQRISVEAKSKHRPGVLGQPGDREPADALNLRFGKLLSDAVAKKPLHPLVVFLDMNMPFETAERFLGPRPPHPFILRALGRLRKEHGGKDPISLLVITNHPQHYTRDDEIAARPHSLTALSQVPEKRVQRPEALVALHQAANLYGNVPQELSSDFQA